MALAEQTIIDQIEVTFNGTIQVRKANIVMRDGTEIAKTFYRYCLDPNSDLKGQPEKVVDIALAAWKHLS